MITSIDGRLLTDRFTPPAGVTDHRRFLWARYQEAEARMPHDGWIAGRRTLESYASSFTDHQLGPATARQDIIGDPQGRSLAVFFDPSGRLYFGKDAMDEHLVFVFSTRVPQAHVDHVRSIGASCLFTTGDGQDIASVLDRLGRYFGATTLLLEGGGRLNGAFLSQGLIDETSTLILPTIDGVSGIPAIYDHQGSKDGRAGPQQAMKLMTCEILDGGVVWLRHAFVPPTVPVPAG